MPKIEIRSGTPSGPNQAWPRAHQTPSRAPPGAAPASLAAAVAKAPPAKARAVVGTARRARLALIPSQDQFGPEHEILVKEVGDLRGELEALADVSRVREIAFERANSGRFSSSGNTRMISQSITSRSSVGFTARSWP